MRNIRDVILFISILFGLIGFLYFGAKISDLEKDIVAVKNDLLLIKSTTPGIDYSELIDDDPMIGDKSAPVLIVEFSDFQCPFCRKFYNETYQKIKSEYIDKDLVKYVFRDFPLSFHASAIPAAIGGECVREQGGDDKYFEYHDGIFEIQNPKGQGTVEITNSEIREVAFKTGIDEDKWNQCFEEDRYEDEVKNDLRSGVELGIQGTPGFFINGQAVSGAQPFDLFKTKIDKILEKSKK